MKLLVTGGCGFLGSNIASSYLNDGAEVVVIDSLVRHGSVANLGWLEQAAQTRRLSFIQADLANYEAVAAVFRRHAPFNYICHVGGQVSMSSSLEDPRRDMETNVIGTFNILEAARHFCPEAFIAYSSTNKVYGDLNWLQYEEMPTRYRLVDYPLGLDEQLNLDFSTPYGCSKGSADQYVRDWARIYGLKTVVFRHSTIYGGRQHASFNQGWIGWFCQKALEQQSSYAKALSPDLFTIAGSGKQVRDVLHSNDLVQLYRSAYTARSAISGQVFNIGGGIKNSLSLLELFGLLSEILQIPPLSYRLTPRRARDQDFFVADCSKVKRMIGWTPTVNYREGIVDMLDWSKESFKACLDYP